MSTHRQSGRTGARPPQPDDTPRGPVPTPPRTSSLTKLSSGAMPAATPSPARTIPRPMGVPEPLLSTFPELGMDPHELVRTLRNGLPPQRVVALRELLDVSATDLGELLSLSSSTLTRRRQGGRLRRDESERTFRFARLLAQACAVMGSMADARTWLKAPQIALGGAAPLQYADTEPGAREVERLLIRIEHGLPV